MSSSSSIWPKNRFSNPVLLTLEKLGFIEQTNGLKHLCKQAGNYSGNLRKSSKSSFFSSWNTAINLKNFGKFTKMSLQGYFQAILLDARGRL